MHKSFTISLVQYPGVGRQTAQPHGVIDTLTAGYSIVNRHLWILLVPILVDLFLWFGPHVSLSPLLDPVLVRATEMVRQVDAASSGGSSSSDVSVDVGAVRQDALSQTPASNPLGFIAVGPLALPSLAAFSDGVGTLAFIYSWREALSLLAGSAAAGLLLGGFFRAALAQAVTGAPTSLTDMLRAVPRALVSTIGLVLTLVALALLLGVPLVFLIAAAATITNQLSALGLIFLGAVTLVAALHLLFTVDAIFVSGVGPLASIQRSVAVVRRYRWSTITLWLLTWTILAGMTGLWSQLAHSLVFPVGILAGVAGNAYITSGLIAASMIFYKERADLRAAQPSSERTGAWT